MVLPITILSQLLLFPVVLSTQVVGTYDQMLDPGRIYWWRSKWSANPIDLSKSNAGATGVSLTFNFSPSTSLVSGVFEVTLPSGFTTSGISGSGFKVVSSSVVQILAVTVTAGADESLTMGPVGLPTASAGYGPFALRTRFASGGQVIDCNLSFATVFITPAESRLGAASISYVSSQSSPIINRAGNTMSFRFTIAKDLWKHDFFKVTVDRYFTVVATTSESMCYSAPISGYIDNFNGTRSYSPNLLDCVVSDKVVDTAQTLWIYGLNTEVIDASAKDNTSVDLRVQGFTNPNRNLDATSYSWTIETIRFGTSNVLEAVTFTGPTTITDSLAAVSWKSTWGISSANMATGLQFSVDFSVTLANPLPSGGTIELTSTETLSGCTVLTYIGLATTCAVSSSTVTISGFDPLKASSLVMVSSLVTIATAAGKTASVKSVVTKWSDGKEVDRAGESAGVVIPSAASVSPVTNLIPTMWNYDTGSVSDGAGGSGTTGQFLSFQVDYTTIAAAALTLYLPMSGAVDDFQIYIPSVPTVYVHTSAITSAPGTGKLVSTVSKVNGSMSRADTGVPTNVAGTIAFTNPTSATSIVIAVYSPTAAMSLQRTTGYFEVRVETKAADGRTIIGVTRQLVNPAAATVTASVFCTNIDLSGFPLKVTFKPSMLDVPVSSSDRTYYLKISLPTSRFPNYHGSGVASGDSYPVDTNLSSPPTMKVSVSGSLLNHYLYGAGYLSATGNGVDIFFPVTYSFTSYTIFTVTVNSCFTLASEKFTAKTEYCIHSGVNTVPAGAASAATDPAGVPTTVSGGAFVTATAASSPMTFSVKLTSGITGDAYFYISLPRGFTFTALKDVQSNNPSAGSSFPEKRYFSSPSASFPFPGVLVRQSFTGTQISSTASTTVSIYGLSAPLGTIAANAVFLHGDLAAVSTNPCAYKSTSGLSMSVVKGAITTLLVSPSTVYAQGPKGVDINHIIQVTLPHGIDRSGSISIQLDAGWTYTTGISSCTVSGLNIDVAGVDMCTGTWPNLKIANFKDFSSVTNQVITIYLNRLLPPANAAAGVYQFVKSLVTYTSTAIASPAVAIDEYLQSASSLVVVSIALLPGVATVQAISIWPPNAGIGESDFYMRFAFPYDLPPDSVISISVPYTPVSTGTGQNKCWLSPLTYSQCSVAGTIAITLAQSYQALGVLEIFVRRAMTTPADVPTSTSTTTYVFKVAASWQGATIIADGGAPYSAFQTVVPSAKVTATIASATPAIAFNPRNAGEAATYTLSFKPSVAYGETDYLHVYWPDEFDPYVGDAVEMLTQDPGNFYLTCSSTQLGSPLWCQVDHWVMKVTGKTAVAAGSQIDLIVQGVRNPGEGTTGSFRVLHYDKDGKLLEYTNQLGTAATVGLPTLIQVRQLAVSNPYLSSTADISLILYAPVAFDSSTRLQLQFPKEFDLVLVDQKDTYPCTTQWVDFASGAVTKTPQEWNTGATCDQASNVVSLSGPSTSKSFVSTNYITWNITSVGTPLWGYPRLKTSALTDFDIQDWDVWTVYSYWTSKFTVFAYWGSTANLRYLAKSYGHTTSAYLGFLANKRTVVVNGYDPRTRANRVVVWPGTQSLDLSITTANSSFPLQAKSLTFTPSINTKTSDSGALKFTSVHHNFIMLQEEWSIYFRVAASIAATKGLYYLDWRVTETAQPGVVSDVYTRPSPTLVEIAPKVVGKYWFSIATIPAVTVGSTSVPIKVSVTNPPHTEVVVHIEVDEVPSVTTNPSELSFRPDVNELYFTVSANSTHSTAMYPTVRVLFTLSGTDADAYSVQPVTVVAVQSKSLYSTGNIAKIGIANIARTSVTIAPTTDQLGVLYYLLQPKGSKVKSFAELKALVPDFIKTDSDIEAQFAANAAQRSSFEADPQDGETWEDFQIRQYIAHVTTFEAYGAIAMISTVTTTAVPIAGLFADTAYQLIAYFDNLNSATSAATRVEYFDTLPTDGCQPVYVRFQYTVNETRTEAVLDVLAKYLGVNPTRLAVRQHALEKYASRALVDINPSEVQAAFTVFSATILPNRALESPSPAQISVLSNEAVNNMKKDFLAVGIANAFWNYGPLSAPTRHPPMWLRTPQVQRFSNVSIIVEFLSAVEGESCCIALLDTNVNLLPEQVYRLYSYNWTQATGKCIDSNSTATINYVLLEGLEPDTNYYVHCVAVDDYPLYPTQMTYTSVLPVPFIPLHTPPDLELRYELEAATALAIAGFLVF